MKLNTIYESQDEPQDTAHQTRSVPYNYDDTAQYDFDLLFSQASKLVQKTFGITLDRIPIESTSNGRFSYYEGRNEKRDSAIYLRPGMDQDQALKELVHEFGHFIFEQVDQEEWLKFLSSRDDWPKHLNIHHANEIFARIFDATVLGNKIDPINLTPKSIWNYAQIQMKKILSR